MPHALLSISRVVALGGTKPLSPWSNSRGVSSTRGLELDALLRPVPPRGDLAAAVLGALARPAALARRTELLRERVLARLTWDRLAERLVEAWRAGIPLAGARRGQSTTRASDAPSGKRPSRRE